MIVHGDKHIRLGGKCFSNRKRELASEEPRCSTSPLPDHPSPSPNFVVPSGLRPGRLETEAIAETSDGRQGHRGVILDDALSPLTPVPATPDFLVVPGHLSSTRNRSNFVELVHHDDFETAHCSVALKL